jgi:hypothetical protein
MKTVSELERLGYRQWDNSNPVIMLIPVGKFQEIPMGNRA